MNDLKHGKTGDLIFGKAQIFPPGTIGIDDLAIGGDTLDQVTGTIKQVAEQFFPFPHGLFRLLPLRDLFLQLSIGMFQFPGAPVPSLLHSADEKCGQNPAQDVKDMEIKALPMPNRLEEKTMEQQSKQAAGNGVSKTYTQRHIAFTGKEGKNATKQFVIFLLNGIFSTDVKG
jgi:hypothetical protein